MNVMLSLKEGSREAHLRLEKRLAIKDRFAQIDLYREHIARLASFYAVAETQWAAWLEPALNDFPARRKASLLARDLAAVGGAPISGARVPSVTDTASALGSFYVLEGATLGGQYLLPLVERRLGLSALHGASYLGSYGTEVGDMWKRFGVAAQAHCQTDDDIGRAVAAARTTFLAMEDWLCGVPAG